jgi:hypothetical protein
LLLLIFFFSRFLLLFLLSFVSFVKLKFIVYLRLRSVLDFVVFVFIRQHLQRFFF